eukprot:CAMPEP_0176073132 /NCGR_PEP_ID=MMETSP0120_2-20121206/36540_1 /TAXON_ID=160619 /ORGANISM="Kryptoperidinium foliaceum, Strain CCMP 1326" /LENGTH=146 /DNA_ID=CAMNT_0017406813 /DNA_START=35 /DNA_END=472 /DNA_ORIENTATION=+
MPADRVLPAVLAPPRPRRSGGLSAPASALASRRMPPSYRKRSSLGCAPGWAPRSTTTRTCNACCCTTPHGAATGAACTMPGTAGQVRLRSDPTSAVCPHRCSRSTPEPKASRSRARRRTTTCTCNVDPRRSRCAATPGSRRTTPAD